MTTRLPISTLASVLALGMLLPACKPKASTDAPGAIVSSEPLGSSSGQGADGGSDKVYPDPPPPSERRAVNFPDAESFTLGNGLTTYVVQNHEVPTVTAQLVIKCGTMDDEHVAPFTAYMLGEGTTTRSKAKIDEAIEFVGGQLGAGAGTHTSTVWSHVLANDAKLALVLMADEVLHPTFPESALGKLKEQSKTSLSYAKSQPSLLASVLFDHVTYPDGHPYGRLFPTPEEIDRITSADLRAFHRKFYQPSNAYLILAGDITPATAKPLVERAFGKWAKGDSLPPNPLNQFTSYPVPNKLVVNVVDRPAAAQSEIRVGNLAIVRRHKDWVALEIANAILGDDASGRLFRDIREKEGLAYAIYSNVNEGQAPGTFVIETRTRTESTGAMLAGIFRHLNAMHDTDPAPEEIDRAKHKLAGQFPLEIETAHHIADKVRDTLTYGLPLDYWRGYWDEYAKVDPAEVRSVAKKYMHALPHVVIVGDAKAIVAQVQRTLPEATIVRWTPELQREK